MLVKTNTLDGAALDWAIAKCLGQTEEWMHDRKLGYINSPSADWAQGGPIIEGATISTVSVGVKTWRANRMDEDGVAFWADGHTPLVAAMRCYVASKLGREIEVPNELMEPKSRATGPGF